MSALDRPVRVRSDRFADRATMVRPMVEIRPSDVLAALTDEQRDELVQRIGRVMHGHLCGCGMPWETDVSYHEVAGAVVDALTDKEQ